jgi:hypothetical protein
VLGSNEERSQEGVTYIYLAYIWLRSNKPKEIRSPSHARSFLLNYAEQQSRLGTHFTETQRVFPSQDNPALLNRTNKKVLPLTFYSSFWASLRCDFFCKNLSNLSHYLCPGLGYSIYPVLSWTVCMHALFPELGISSWGCRPDLFLLVDHGKETYRNYLFNRSSYWIVLPLREKDLRTVCFVKQLIWICIHTELIGIFILE